MKAKKVLGIALAAMMYAMSASAAQVNTIIDTGSGMFAQPEKVYEQVDNTIVSWFFPNQADIKKMTFSEKQALLKNTDVTLVPVSDSDAIVQIYREEHGKAAAIDNAATGESNRDMSMTKEDLSNLSKELGSDYIFYFRITNSIPTMSVGLFTAGQKSNVTTDFRVWDNKAQNYTFVKRYQTTGASNSFYIGAGSASNAVKKGLDKALQQITQDKDKIIAAVKK